MNVRQTARSGAWHDRRVERVRVLTWNIQGGHHPDLALLHEVLAEHAADVVVLQEVERGQARRLAALGGWSSTWRFKHWPIVRAPQGQAILAREPLQDEAVVVLARRWRWWSWRRRIATAATVSVGGPTIRVVNLHLGPAVAEARRVEQVRRLLASLDSRDATVLAGDFNAEPDASTMATVHSAGFTDRPAGSDAGVDQRGPTNWRAGPRTDPPTQQLDHVLVGHDLVIRAVRVPAFGEAGFGRYPTLSDHLPVVADVKPRITG